ncbi:hypothetical protein, partial [Longimicrobium sp.]|uniref:hypothetical protein n=1 Tax=Longimicrobium sp. TaxID=2029185 RepID=UPI002E32E0AA
MRISRLLWAVFAAVLAFPAGARSQSTGELVVTYAGTGTDARFKSCSFTIDDSLPDSLFTNSVLVRFQDSLKAPLKAPYNMRLQVGARDTQRVATGADTVRLVLVRSALRGSEVRLIREGETGAICAHRVEEEEGGEIDPAFQLLAGVEFLSVDGFEDREVHIPATAQWIIPVHVREPKQPSRTTSFGAAFWQRLTHWYGNPYALLTTSAEFTRVPGQEFNYACAPTTILRTVDPETVAGTRCSANQPRGTDSLTVFREAFGDTTYSTLSAWRITSSYRHEGNLGWADNDVYAGPLLILGLQTDPGIGAPDFFWYYTLGLSLTQVEITDEGFTERFNLQAAWGRSPNYAEKVVILPDS